MMGLSSNMAMSSRPQWFPSMEMSLTQDQGLVGLNGTKHDSVIVKNSPQRLKGWNVSQSVVAGYSLSRKHLLYSYRKHLPWANRVVMDIKVLRGVTHSAHYRSSPAPDSFVPPRNPWTMHKVPHFYKHTEGNEPKITQVGTGRAGIWTQSCGCRTLNSDWHWFVPYIPER